MKNYGILLLLLVGSHLIIAQERLAQIQPPSIMFSSKVNVLPEIMPNEDFLTLPKDLSLVALSSQDGTFYKTYHINKDGETVSSGYMPASYFMPNNNLIVVSGKRYVRRDSFNPYGAEDLPTMLLFGTVNNFISKLKIGRR